MAMAPSPRESSNENAPADDGSDGIIVGSSRQRHHRRNRRRSNNSNSTNNAKKEPKWLQFKTFIAFLVFDALLSLIFLSPLFPQVEDTEDVVAPGDSSLHHYKVYKTLWDLGICTCLRITTALYVLFFAFQGSQSDDETDDGIEEETTQANRPELFHANGDRKSKAELEEEALEEPFWPKIRRFMRRPAFLCEFSVFGTGVLLSVKCLVRLNVELSSKKEVPEHPVFWIVLSLTAICSFVETVYIDHIESVARLCGKSYRERSRDAEGRSELSEPLLSNREELDPPSTTDNTTPDDEENGSSTTPGTESSQEASSKKSDEDIRGRSEIGPDANYKASFSDLLAFCAPDMYLMMLAFLFLIGAAVTQVFIPRFTGDILDALISHATEGGGKDDPDYDVAGIPGFVSNIELLTITAILGGIFGGCRGAIFTMVGARVNVRLRVRLMDSLLLQEIGFFDTTRTGDITSRLGSDTTLVGSSMTSSVNVFLRSTVRAAGTLIFMFVLSWQLSLLAFITIPAVTILSKWYGRFLRNLARIQQKKLADGNNVSESTISSMPTVRAFGAELVEMTEFEKCMEKYISLNK